MGNLSKRANSKRSNSKNQSRFSSISSRDETQNVTPMEKQLPLKDIKENIPIGVIENYTF